MIHSSGEKHRQKWLIEHTLASEKTGIYPNNVVLIGGSHYDDENDDDDGK